MRQRCKASVQYALGRPLREGEADVLSARVVEGLRQDAKDRDTWNSRTREQHLRAVGDRLMREVPDQALEVERKKTDAMQEQLDAIDGEIAAITAAGAITPSSEPYKGGDDFFDGDRTYNQSAVEQPEAPRAPMTVGEHTFKLEDVTVQYAVHIGGSSMEITSARTDAGLQGEETVYAIEQVLRAADARAMTVFMRGFTDAFGRQFGFRKSKARTDDFRDGVLIRQPRTYFQGLDMSQEARHSRATALGFDVSLPLYHASNKDLTELKRLHGAREAKSRLTGEERGMNALGIWLSSRGDEAGASMYAHGEAGVVYPVFARIRKPYIIEGSAEHSNPDVAFKQFFDLIEEHTGTVEGDGTVRRAASVAMRDIKPLRDWLLANGYDAVVLRRTWGDSTKTMPPQDMYIILHDENVRSAFAAFEADQSGSSRLLAHTGAKPSGEAVVRGSTTFHEDANERIVAATMRLTEAANFSTFLHESGHIFLEIVRELAAAENATDDVRRMWADIMDWFDIDGDTLPSTPHHELFARTFEAYLREGRAPSMSLARIFSTFRKWLVKIYETVSLQHHLDGRIGSVFDRIFATDQEIAEARATAGQETSIFRNREEAGMTAAEWDSYQQRREDAENDAKAALTATAMDAYYRQQTAWWNRQLGKKRRLAAQEVDSDPVRRAHDWIAYGKVRGEIERQRNGEELESDWGFVDPPVDLQPMTLSLPAVAEDYGQEALDALPATVRPVDKKRAQELVALARRVRQANSARKQPRRLASFVVQNGGLRDDGGDVLSILGSHRARPGLINNTNGRSLDDMALIAWENGYFGAKPTKGNFEHYQEDLVVDTNARLENIRIVPATPDTQPRLSAVVSIKVGDPEADFWIVRRGTPDSVGSVTREFNPEHYGVRVTRPDVMVPDYLYYALMHVHSSGAFKAMATGTLRLVNIRKQDILGIPLGAPLKGEPETRSGTVAEGGATLDVRPPLKPRVYYAADHDTRPTIAQFLEALASDLRGEPIYKVEDLDDVWSTEELREWEQWFDARGIDLAAHVVTERRVTLRDGTTRVDKVRVADTRAIEAQIQDYLRKQEKQPNATHPDVIAHAFGIRSGDELLSGLAALKPRRELIEARAAEMVRAEYGDPYDDGTMEDEATAAAHRAMQSRVMELELEALDRASQGNGRAIARAARKLAQQRVETMTVRQIRGFERILGQERRHARLAEEAFRRGDLATASLEKKAQLIAFHTYAEARNAAQGIDTAERLFRSFDKVTTRKSLDGFHLAQIDQLLEQFELRRISLREQSRRESLASYVLKMRERGMDHLLAIDPRRMDDTKRRPFGQLTWDEVQGLRDTVKNLAHLGRLKQGLLIKRERMRIQDVENAIVAQIESNGPVDKASRAGFSPNALERMDEGRRQFHAESTKMEFLFRLLDGLQDNGPVWRHLFRPIAEAEAAELEMSQLAAERLEKLFSVYTRKERARLFRAPTMEVSIGRVMTKAERISVALNMGNQYNMQVMLAGYGWSPEQAMSIVNRLDKRDLDLVQAIWDWIAEFKEPRFALHERLTGVRPLEVEPLPLKTWHGVYRGGYYPVKYNAQVNEKTHRREAAVTTLDEFGGNFIRPATKQGAMQERKGSGGQVVRLDLSVLHEHIAESVHDITHREAVIDTLRLIERPGVQQAIINAVGREQYRQLRPWLADIAQEPKNPATVLERVLQRVRGNASIVAMGWKITTALVQPLGIVGAIPRLGAGRIARQIARLYGRPDKLPSAFQFALDRSAMMRHLTQTFDRDVKDSLASVRGRAEGDPVPAKTRQTFFWMTSTLQMGVSVTVWTAAYEQARAGHAQNIQATDEDAAIQYADSVVRMTQGSGSIKDQSRLLRQKGFMRLFTMFQTYFSTLYNQLYVEQVPGLAIGRIPFPVFFVNLVWLWFGPAIMAEMLQGRGGPDDDETPEDAAKRVAGVVLTYPLMGVIGVRDVAQAMVSDYGYEITPVGAAGTALADVGGDVLAADIGEGTLKQAWMASGYWFGLPSRQVWITFDYIKDSATGEEDPLGDPGSIWSEGLMRDKR